MESTTKVGIHQIKISEGQEQKVTEVKQRSYSYSKNRLGEGTLQGRNHTPSTWGKGHLVYAAI